jgi:hypothetical protein
MIRVRRSRLLAIDTNEVFVVRYRSLDEACFSEDLF